MTKSHFNNNFASIRGHAVSRAKVMEKPPVHFVLLLALLFFLVFFTTVSAQVSDEFNGGVLKSEWNVINTHPECNVYVNSSGKLVLDAADDNTVLNSFSSHAPRVVQPVNPDEDWIIDVRFKVNISHGYNGAGIFVVLDNKTVWRIAEQSLNDETYGYKVHMLDVPHHVGGPRWMNFRLRKIGNRLIGWYKDEDIYPFWSIPVAKTISGKITHIGLFAGRKRGRYYPSSWGSHCYGQFDYFRIRRPPFKLQSDEFNKSYLDRSKWIDISLNDSSRIYYRNGYVSIRATGHYKGADLYYKTNYKAPRIMQHVDPDRDWVLETKLRFTPVGDVQYAGVLIKFDGNGYWRVAQRGISRKLTQNNWGARCVGGYRTFNYSTTWFRIEKTGNTFRGYISSNGVNWSYSGSSTRSGMVTEVGLFSVRTPYDGVRSRYTVADFDYFRLEYTNDDTTPPTSGVSLDPAPNAGGWNNTDVNVTVSSTDDSAGVQEIAYSVNGGSIVTTAGTSVTFPLTAEGTHTVAYKASDKAGNIEAEKTITVRIDKTAPQTASIVTGDGSGAVFNNSAAVQLTATDSLSGINEIRYSVDGGAELVYAGSFVIDTPGNHTVAFYALDNAGNIETQQTLDLEIIDTIPPVSSLAVTPTPNANGWYVSAINIAITSTDVNGSGVKEIVYSLDGAAAVTVPGDTMTMDLASEAKHTFTYFARDNAGNAETAKTVPIFIDMTAPVTSYNLTGHGVDGKFITQAAVELSSTDNVSGVKEIRYSINGEPEQIISASTASFLLDTPGTYDITYYALDNAGHTETARTVTVIVIVIDSAPGEIKDIITELPPDAFSGNSTNQIKTFTNKLDSVIDMIENGDYQQAIDKLENDVRKKLDGCVKKGAPDKNDWITDCEAQALLNEWIDITVASLLEKL